MRVRELIERLQEFDDELDIEFEDLEGSEYSITDVVQVVDLTDTHYTTVFIKE